MIITAVPAIHLTVWLFISEPIICDASTKYLSAWSCPQSSAFAMSSTISGFSLFAKRLCSSIVSTTSLLCSLVRFAFCASLSINVVFVLLSVPFHLSW